MMTRWRARDVDASAGTGRSFQSFATKLRLHRLRRCLTQEELAHASGLSVRAVRNFEIGAVLHPRRDSVRRLADALELPEETRREFVDLTRVDRDGFGPGPVTNTLYLKPDAAITLTLRPAGDRGTVTITAARTNVHGEPVVTVTVRAGRTIHRVAR